MLQRREVTLLLLGAISYCVARASSLDAPNAVEVSATLVTSGQPSRRALEQLGSFGFRAVVYLAPSTVPDAVKDEPALVRNQGMEFVHIPIPFMEPKAEHFEALTQVLGRLADKKTLVHCQVNMRASTMVFLHRVITLKEEPNGAYEAVTKVWSPQGPWRVLVLEQLSKHNVRFQPM